MGAEEASVLCRFAAGTISSKSRRLPEPKEELMDAIAVEVKKVGFWRFG